MKVELNREQLEVQTGKDSIVIVNALGDVPGGRSLDVSDLAEDVEVIHAGHIIIKETATGAAKPLPVSGEAYEALPEGHTYWGVLKVSVLKKDARAAIVTIGQVNAAASPYPVTEQIKAGLPRIEFLY